MNDIRHRFRMAACKHLGEFITPEVAAQIEAEAFGRPSVPATPAPAEAVEFYRGEELRHHEAARSR